MTSTEPRPDIFAHRNGEPLSDALLLQAVRDGSTAAFGVLYARHRDHAVSVARRTLSRDDRSLAEDVVEAAFIEVLAALRNGRGPTDTLRYYLITAVRRQAWRVQRRQRRQEDIAGRWVASGAVGDGVEPPVDRGDPSDVLGEHTVLSSVFRGLPERWRHVLWLTEVEGRKPAEVATLLGLSPSSAAALAYRARKGLASAYLSAYGARRQDPACKAIAPRLAAHVAARPSGGDPEVRRHLEGCQSCRDAVRGIDSAGPTLGVLAPFGLLTTGLWAKVASAGAAGAAAEALVAAGGVGAAGAGAAGVAAVASQVSSGSAAVGAGAGAAAGGGTLLTAVAAVVAAVAIVAAGVGLAGGWGSGSGDRSASGRLAPAASPLGQATDRSAVDAAGVEVAGATTIARSGEPRPAPPAGDTTSTTVASTSSVPDRGSPATTTTHPNSPTPAPVPTPTVATTTVPTTTPATAPTTVATTRPTIIPTTTPTVVPTSAPTTLPTEPPASASGSLSGRAVLDTSGQGDGTGVAGVAIRAVQLLGKGSFSAVTGADGRWQIAQVPKGTYIVIAEVPAGYRPSSGVDPWITGSTWSTVLGVIRVDGAPIDLVDLRLRAR